MKELTMLIGLPRSGKSTWVGARHGETDVIISADKLRLLTYGQRFYSDGEPIMWAVRGILLKTLMEQGTDIIVDETNTTIETRAKLIKLAKSYGYSVYGVWIDTEASECVRRAKATGQADLEPIIDKLAYQFVPPSLSEGFDLIKSYTDYKGACIPNMIID